ncbi:serine protease snake-like isoform X2 [Galleria mellonella]|uniref:Serine protease snake-like isoform X2 n=1 Tax=Galleria mellonella TaxID=7137 RepID=A0ABM3MLW9_GALME|nr:serine protease snake-like isoform X2 [Galleria mellonella]
MKMFILQLYFIVAAVQCIQTTKEKDARHKRTNVNQRQLSKLTATTLPPNPCLDPPPVQPDFTAPGRRISVTKCYEYIWQLKDGVDKIKRDKICYDYQSKYLGIRFVISGRFTQHGEFPHMGAIGWRSVTDTWLFNCGSTLISPKFVLTAGHCTKASPRDSRIADVVPKIIRFGVKNLVNDKNIPTDRNISRIIPHPQYKPPKQYFDIALMELVKEVTFSKEIQPACLWSKNDDSYGAVATVTGWGVFKNGNRNTSDELQAGDIYIVDTFDCDLFLMSSSNRHWDGIKNHQLCAGKLEGGVDACQGDSGGPLQVKIPFPEQYETIEGTMHYVVGITSFGVGCALPNLPGVYTRVSSFIDWIENIVWVNQ